MSDAFEITSASPADEAEIARIGGDCFGLAWSPQAIAHELTLPHVRGWAARVGGRIRGFALLGRAADEVEIRLIGVDPAARRDGIATALLSHALDAETTSGAARALLEVRAGNQAARRLYARAGFAVVGERRRYYPDGEDAVVLARQLAPLAVECRSGR